MTPTDEPDADRINLEAMHEPTTPATMAKADAIAAVIRSSLQRIPANLYAQILGRLLARLTSANKLEREQAKADLRRMVNLGAGKLRNEQKAADLASFANRYEP